MRSDWKQGFHHQNKTQFQDGKAERVNKAIISGIVIETPQRRTTHSGHGVLQFAVETEENYTNKTGENRTRRIRHNICAYGRLADDNEFRVRKGQCVLIEGSIQNEYMTENAKGFRSDVVVKSIEFPSNLETASSTSARITQNEERV